MTIDYVKMYDVYNNILSSWLTDFDQCITGVTYTLYEVPENTYKVEYKIDSNVYTVYSKGCSTEQYYYFGNKYVDVLYCTGKKENGINIDRKTISDKNDIVELTIQETVTQNTGLKLSASQLFDFGSTPYIFQIDNTNITRYLLDNQTFSGYDDKMFGSRNTILNLTKDNVTKRYTTKENNFYS